MKQLKNLESFMEEKLKEIKYQVLDCKKCPLYKTRVYPVIGEGSHQADIMLIGEAPGFNESKTGRPFCGAAGKILDELLESAGIKRKDIYITNILKCRPPKNRDPQEEEIKACSPYLEKQIQLINPKTICPLGNYASQYILKKYGLEDEIQGISKMHGRIFEKEKRIIPLYHPAVALYNANMKEVLKKDIKKIL